MYIEVIATIRHNVVANIDGCNSYLTYTLVCAMVTVFNYFLIKLPLLCYRIASTITFISYCGVYHLDVWVIHLYVIHSGGSP